MDLFSSSLKHHDFRPTRPARSAYTHPISCDTTRHGTDPVYHVSRCAPATEYSYLNQTRRPFLSNRRCRDVYIYICHAATGCLLDSCLNVSSTLSYGACLFGQAASLNVIVIPFPTPSTCSSPIITFSYSVTKNMRAPGVALILRFSSLPRIDGGTTSFRTSSICCFVIVPAGTVPHRAKPPVNVERRLDALWYSKMKPTRKIPRSTGQWTSRCTSIETKP